MSSPHEKLEQLRAFLKPTTLKDVIARIEAQEREAESAAAAEARARKAEELELLAAKNPEPTEEELALPLASVYLLFRGGQDVEWSLQRDTLLAALAHAKSQGGAYALGEVLEAQVPGWVAKRLHSLDCTHTGVPTHKGTGTTLPPELEGYVEKHLKASENPPDWKKAGGNRVYVVFTTRGYCGWSPSGNNLSSIVQRAPKGIYVGQPLRVALTPEQEARLFGYFDWACDSW